MDRESKIVLSIFLTYIIYGLGSLFNSGAFVAPIFLNQLIILGVCFSFFVLNANLKSSYKLLLLFIGFLSYAFQDPFTTGYLDQRMGWTFLPQLLESISFNIITFFIFFFMLFMFIIQLYTESEKKGIALLPLGFLLPVLALFITDWFMLQTALMSLFCISYFILAQKLIQEEHSLAKICSNVLLLFLLLESVEFLN